jgi:hypothetical protein
MARHCTTGAWAVPKLYGIYFLLFLLSPFLESKLLIMTNVAQEMQLGWLANEASDALRHPPNSTASHSALRAFTEVIMVSISVLHLTISLNYLYCRLFFVESASVLNGWCFTATASDPSMWSIRFHRMPQQVHRLP